MNKWAQYIPEGMRDYLFEEMRCKRKIERSVMETFEHRGYSEVCTPTMEFFDVFHTHVENVPIEDLYKLFDAKGRILTLRHDMTTPISRVASTKLRGNPLPIKLCYNQNVFRNNEYLNGKRDEITQCGVELLGFSNERADVEVLITAIEAMKAAVGGAFTIELGHVGFFQAITEDLDADRDTIEQMRQSIEKKNFAELDHILAELPQSAVTNAIGRLPRLFGDGGVMDEALELAPNEKAKGILHGLQSIISQLQVLGYGDYVGVDLGMVHHIGYYTGLIFRGYLKGSGENCLAGGRYDSLSENFGGELPSTGFAITVDSVMDTLKKLDSMPVEETAPTDVIFYDEGCIKEAYRCYEACAKQGLTACISLEESAEQALENARLAGAKTFHHVQMDRSERVTL